MLYYFFNALEPIAIFLLPVVLVDKANDPIAILLELVEIFVNESGP